MVTVKKPVWHLRQSEVIEETDKTGAGTIKIYQVCFRIEQKYSNSQKGKKQWTETGKRNIKFKEK